jgi:hypothetical protein
MPEFVQFIHPGGEHGPDVTDRKLWNVGEHRRKFLRIGGEHVERPGERPVSGDVVLWGEWEAESEVESISQPLPRGPRWLHRPYYVRPEVFRRDGQVLQNTDPFIFGDRFMYTLCRQWRNSTQKPTRLRDLSPGSLILFGSLKAGEFVLDTVFVTDEGVLHDFHSWPSVLGGRVSGTYADVTMRPTYEWGEGATLRLYTGATAEAPTNGMFSFAPCLPLAACERGFERPAIRLDGFVTPGLMMGFKMSRSLTPEQVRGLWESVTGQVINADLALGTSFALPERRDA